MFKTKRNTEMYEQREQSPVPIPSQSPDFATRNIIVATRAPTKSEIADKLNTTMPSGRSKAPLIDQISELRRQNDQLKRQIEKLRSKPNYYSRPIDNNQQLTKALNQKDNEIIYLKSQIKQLRRDPKQSTRKISLTKSFSPIDNNNELQIRINQIIEENEQMKRSIKQEQVKKFQEKILELQNQNNQLSRMLSKYSNTASISPQKQNPLSDTYYVRSPPRKLSEYELVQIKENFLSQANYIEQQVYNRHNKKVIELELKLQHIERKYQRLRETIKKPSFLDTAKSGTKRIFPQSSTVSNSLRTPPRGQDIKEFTLNKSNQGQYPSINEKNLQDELSQTRNNLEELTKLLHSKNQENQKLSSQLIKLKNELKNSKKFIQRQSPELLGELENLRKQKIELLSYIDKLNDNIQPEQSNPSEKIYYENELKRLRSMIDNINADKNQQIIYFKKQNKSLKDNIQALKRFHHDNPPIEPESMNSQEINRLNKEIEKLRQEKSILEQQLLKTHKQKPTTSSQEKLNKLFADALRKQNSELAGKLKGLQKQYLELKKEYQKLKSRSAIENISISDYNLRNKVSDLQRQLNNTKEQLQTLTYKYEQLDHQYSQKSNQLQLLKLEQYKHELVKIELEGEKSNNKHLNQENERLKAQFHQISQNLKQFESMKFQYDRLLREILLLQSDNQRLKELLHNKNEESKITNSELAELKLLLQSLDIVGIQSELGNIMNQLKEVKRKSHEIEQYKSMIQKLKRQIVKLQEMNIRLNEQSKNQTAKIVQLQTLIQNLKINEKEYSKLIQQYVNAPKSIIEHRNQEGDDEQEKRHNSQIHELKSKVNLAIQNLDHISSKLNSSNMETS